MSYSSDWRPGRDVAKAALGRYQHLADNWAAICALAETVTLERHLSDRLQARMTRRADRPEFQLEYWEHHEHIPTRNFGRLAARGRNLGDLSEAANRYAGGLMAAFRDGVRREQLGHPWLRTSELARIFGVSPSLIYRLCKNGVLPTIRFGKLLLVDRDRLEAWIAEQVHAPKPSCRPHPAQERRSETDL